MKDKKQNHLIVLFAELLLFISLFFSFYTALSTKKVYAISAMVPVGGYFAPGVFDIFTPSLCGLLVTVIGPNPGVFIWTPINIYRGFYEHPTHVGDNVLGIAGPPLGICPPPLYILGSTSYFPY